jgi:hypothetical protein
MTAHKNQLVVEFSELLLNTGRVDYFLKLMYFNEDSGYDHSKFKKYDVFNVSITDFDERMQEERLNWHPEVEKLIVDFMLAHNSSSVIICTAKGIYLSQGIGHYTLEKMAQKAIDSGIAEVDCYTLRKGDRYLGRDHRFTVPYIRGNNFCKFMDKSTADSVAEKEGAQVVVIAR